MKFSKQMESPVGLLTLLSDGESITALCFDAYTTAEQSCPVLEQAIGELGEYFAGNRREFTVALRGDGTAFQRTVWDSLREIPYGETRTYAELARIIGHAGAYRAVGNANHRNPLPILVPCHRVIGKNGALTGYAGGLERKLFLLDLEKCGCKET